LPSLLCGILVAYVRIKINRNQITVSTMGRDRIGAVHLITLIFLLGSTFSGYSREIPFPDPGHEGLKVNTLITSFLDDGRQFRLGLWMQNRVMYNMSNLPGPGGSTFDNTSRYDFFRQRYRFGIDMSLYEAAGVTGAGVYIQPEFRGGWGGSSPAVSDPRGMAPVNNPYNRLQPRGLRYAFAYYERSSKLHFAAGILPVTDRCGRMLFDSDWDFNVGGIVAGGTIGKWDYRMGYVRMIDGVGGTMKQSEANAGFWVADLGYSTGEGTILDISAYYLNNPFDVMIARSMGWYGITGKTKVRSLDLGGAFVLNSGTYLSEEISGSPGVFSTSGTAVKLEATIPVGRGEFSVQTITTSGDSAGGNGSRFITPQQVVGTAGYWGYTHIFTPQGPSDVNDLGLEVGNGGFGLTTIQAKGSHPLIAEKLSLQLFGGWFRSNGARFGSHDMGVEYGLMFTLPVWHNLTLEAGAAMAHTGAFYGVERADLYQVFSRLQFAW